MLNNHAVRFILGIICAIVLITAIQVLLLKPLQGDIKLLLEEKETTIQTLIAERDKKNQEALEATTALDDKVESLAFKRYEQEILDRNKDFEKAVADLNRKNLSLQEINAKLKASVESSDSLLKNFSIVINPYIEYKSVTTIFEKSFAYRLGYQYQLLFSGMPVLEPSYVITEETKVKLISPMEDMLLSLTKKALEIALETAGNAQSNFIHITVVQNVIKKALNE